MFYKESGKTSSEKAYNIDVTMHLTMHLYTVKDYLVSSRRSSAEKTFLI